MKLFTFNCCDDFGCSEYTLELGVFKGFALASFTFSIDPESACFIVSFSIRSFPKYSFLDVWVDIGIASCYFEILKPYRFSKGKFRA